MDSIGKKMLSGTFYVAIAKYSNVVFQILITSILARILTPKDYGIIAIATVFIVFFNILSDIGIGPAIIQKKELRQQDFESLHSFNIYLGVILCLVFFYCHGRLPVCIRTMKHCDMFVSC